MVINRGFRLWPKKKLREHSIEAGRTPASKKAWGDKGRIQMMYSYGIPVKHIAEEYEVSYRTIYRIIDKFFHESR